MLILLCLQYLGLRTAVLEASVDRQEQAIACSILDVALLFVLYPLDIISIFLDRNDCVI